VPPLTTPVRGRAGGVPFLAVPPLTPRREAPVVLLWHLMDPPRTETALAAALPLAGLDAWRIYLGLPLSGARLPAGGLPELERLGYEDAVLNLQGPVATQGAQELPGALAELEERLDLSAAPLAVLGGSMGSAVAQLVLAEGAVEIAAAVLVSPIAQLRAAVDALGRRYGVTYPWGPASLEVARRLDFVERAAEIAGRGQPAVRLVVGAEDDREGFGRPAERLRAALAQSYEDPARVDLVVVPGMEHALAQEPGLEPAPQMAAAAAVDSHAVDWLRAHGLGEPALPA